MTTILIIWFGLGLVLAPFTYAWTLAYFQGEFPSIAETYYKKDIRTAILFGVLAIFFPIPVMGANLLTFKKFKHGLKWK